MPRDLLIRVPDGCGADVTEGRDYVLVTFRKVS